MQKKSMRKIAEHALEHVHRNSLNPNPLALDTRHCINNVTAEIDFIT
jgi:hypothetical protein